MSALLQVKDLHAWYDKSHIIQGISFEIYPGELVAILGRNGAGKTTTMRSIMGLIPQVRGDIAFHGESISGLPSHVITRKGISYVPEHRGIFASLTVRENLQLAHVPGSRWSVDDALEMFPALKERLRTPGGKLSGGEQQMLAITRALMVGPKLLLLDEPTEGLAPVIVDRVVELLRKLKALGLPILLVEQSLDVCRALADRHIIIDQGRVAWTGSTAELDEAGDVLARHLTLEHA